MKKSIAIMMIWLQTLVLIGCKQDIGLEGLEMGDSEETVMEFLNSQGAVIEPRYDDWIRATGKIDLWKMKWDKVCCQFKDGDMVFISLIKPLAEINNTFINYLDATLEEEFGDSFSRAKEQIKVFGYDNKWVRYEAAYKLDFENNQFMLMFKKKE